MKKILTLCFAVLTMATTAKAQFEIGAVVGGMNGASCKYWFSDNLALQTDLAVGLTYIYGAPYMKGNKLFNEDGYSIYDFIINPNVAYHFDLPSNFQFYVGGGVSLGMMNYLETKTIKPGNETIMGKFGVNGLLGVAYNLDAVPLVLALDIRPGYGLGFKKADESHLSFFDWKVAFAVRYKL